MVSFSVVDDVAQSRFEARADDGTVLGFIDYRPARYTGEDSSPADVAMTHAEVDDHVEGQGIGTRLAREALDQVRASGRGVLPLCAFVQAFIAEHPEYQDLVRTEQDRGQGG
jgi:predicted GNAT family acetyltransferase